MKSTVHYHAAVSGQLPFISMRQQAREPSRGGWDRGFTLIELLVVLGIIGIVIAILLPAIHKATDTSKILKCLTNIKALAQSANAYTADNRDYMPNGTLPHGAFTHASFGGAATSWITTMSSYYASGAILRSPGDPTSSTIWSTFSGGNSAAPLGTSGTRFTSYAINNLVTATATDGSVTTPATYFTAINQLSQVPRPASTIQWAMLTWDTPSTAASDLYFCIDHLHLELWFGASAINYKTQTYTAANIQCQIAAYGGASPPDGSGVSNYSYLDGHAETTILDNIYKVKGAGLVNISLTHFDPARSY